MSIVNVTLPGLHPVSSIFGFSAEPDSPSSHVDTPTQKRQHSLLSDLLRDMQAGGGDEGSLGGGQEGSFGSERPSHAGGAARCDQHLGCSGADRDHDDDDDDDDDDNDEDDDDEATLDEDELSLLEDLSAAWSSPSSSVFSRASSSRPITIPVSS
jgi:hypothetical protein